jgi:hypothetical protein
VHFYAFRIHVEFYDGILSLDVTILTGILKGAENFELKFFQIGCFLKLLKKLSPHNKMRNSLKF